MAQELNHRRQAWMVMREYCEKQSRKRGAFGWAMTLLAGRKGSATLAAGDDRREVAGDRMMDYAVAVDVCADRLSPAERYILRANNTLPDWFIDAVEKERAQLKRQR